MSADLPSEQAAKPLTPEVTWAQRSSKEDAEKNFIWLSILASDIPASSLKLDLQSSSLKFAGYSNSKKSNYSLDLEFYAEIDPSASKVHHTERAIELKLQKKDLQEEYWPRLLKDKSKMHFLRTDFDKWVDEDEQDAVPEDDYMNQFGGMPGGMPGMGMGGDGGFGGLDFSKLGGGAGLGGLGGEGGEEDMPDLEDEEGEDGDDGDEAEASGSTANDSPKIQEVN